LAVIGILGTVFPEPFVWTQTFRLSPDKAAVVVPVATYLFRFFSLQVVLYGAGAIISALLNSQRSYFWPAVGPIFNNIVAIAAMLTFAALHGELTGPGVTAGLAPVVLAAGTTLAVVVMFAVQLPAVLKTGWRWSWGLGLRDPAIHRLLRLAVPTVIYVATNLVAVSFRNASAFAATPDSSGPAVLTYAWMFYQLPYGILAVALATAVFTELSDAAGKQDTGEFRSIFSRGLRATVILILPTSAMLIALATPLMRLFRFGAFTAADIPIVASAIRWWAAGLVFYAVTMFLLRTFYSLKDTRTPMWVDLVLTFGMRLGLYVALSTGVGGWHGLGVNGIPIADSIFYLCVAAVLAVLVYKRIDGYDVYGAALVFARMTLASVVGALVAWGLAALIAQAVGGVPGALLQIAVGGVLGIVAALGLGRLLGVTEVSFATQLFDRAIRRTKKRP
jgi:putative peptidoglycan lipid II flippase